MGTSLQPGGDPEKCAGRLVWRRKNSQKKKACLQRDYEAFSYCGTQSYNGAVKNGHDDDCDIYTFHSPGQTRIKTTLREVVPDVTRVYDCNDLTRRNLVFC